VKKQAQEIGITMEMGQGDQMYGWQEIRKKIREDIGSKNRCRRQKERGKVM
jgi:hypothetical protein